MAQGSDSTRVSGNGDEFAPGVLDEPTSMERREFMRLMAAALAMGAATGCSRAPPEGIIPFTHNQKRFIPGVPQMYATSVTRGGYGMGVLARSDDGRPTKIEGNPDHPASLGATDAIMQAELLCLYDPERSASVRRGGVLSDWETFERWVAGERGTMVDRGGEGVHVVLGPTTSPTVTGMIERLSRELPRAAWYRHETMGGDSASAGVALATGRALDVVVDLSRAKTVVCLDADLFGPRASGVRHIHDFSRARRGALGAGATPPLLLTAEPVPTTTGARSDSRLAARRSEIAGIADAVEAALKGRSEPASLSERGRAWALRAAGALRSAGADGLVAAGAAQPAEVHAAALRINAAIGAIGRTARLIEPVEAYRLRAKRMAECVAAMEAGAVDVLLLLGVNPAYDFVERTRFVEGIARVRTAVHMGLHRDETAGLCEWHLPATHDLEQWGDARAFDGTAGILQPLATPLYGGRSILRVLAMLAGERLKSDLDLVKEQWRGRASDREWDEWWRTTLKAGVVEGSAAAGVEAKVSGPAAPAATAAGASRGEGANVEITFSPHRHLLDGRYAGCAWLQELPDSITQLTWQNVAAIGPVLAERLGVDSGDKVRVGAGGSQLDYPVLVSPGVAEGTIGLTLGGGRWAAGPVGTGRGVDVQPLRQADSEWSAVGSCEAIGGSARLALVQLHDDMQGRDIVRVARPGERPARDEVVHLPLYKAKKPASAQQWGMSIDLSACVGCGACVAACQAENNVPVVGPEEVMRGRRMHWLRVDRYYDGDRANPEILFQPLACVHCEEAPCELVCPTGATQHSNDGLNEMNYARCVGTRYCANNCPYKVRRFNYFRYADDSEAGARMRNPRVTSRGRGVMEKCTYCVQRIRSAEFDARARGEPIRDGAVVPACQQACPAQAIVFGDVADPASRVSKVKSDPRTYSLLGELNTKPRTTYLADVRPAAEGGST